MKQSPAPRISVVIPHLNEPEDLRNCLAALTAQRADGIPFEIIVVDNGSRTLPVAVCNAFADVHLDNESTPGPGPARSQGARHARAEIIAFIDADCLAQPGWIRTIDTYFSSHPEIDSIAGDIDIVRSPGRPDAIEAYEAIFSYRIGLYVSRHHYAATGNMAVRRSVFEAVGPFGGIGSMEDWDWGQRARAKGFRLAFVPAARVLTPACKSFAELTRRWDRHVAHEYAQVRPTPSDTARWVMRGMALAVSPAYELVRLALMSGTSLHERTLALWCLARIRRYRVRRMLELMFEDNSHHVVRNWNRE